MKFFELFTRTPKPVAATLPVGGFEGANNGYTPDRGHLYTSAPDEAANPPAYARQELLSIVRYLVNNYAIVERCVSVAENYSVGAGIYAQGATKDAVFNDEATKAFDFWASSVFCSNTNDLNLFDMQKLAVREIFLAGEIFFVMINSAGGFPQLMPVASENVRGTGKKNDKSTDGLFVDPYGKVTAYQIWTGKGYQIVEAANVIHLKRLKNVGQLRGVSAFAASVNSLRDHRDLQNLEKRATKLHATLAATVTKKSGEAGDGVYGSVNKAPTVKDGKTVANRGLEKAFGGSVVYLKEGEGVELLSSDRATDGFIKFLELLLRDVCLNLSLPYEFVVNPSSLSGPSVRFCIQDADVLFRNTQNLLIDSALSRIYSWVTAVFVNTKRISKRVDDYYSASWVRPASISIDQGRVSSAEIALIQNSLLSFDSYYSARGMDYKQALRQKATEEAYLDELAREFNVPIERLRTLPPGAASATSVEPAPEIQEDEDEDEQKAA